MAVVSLSGQTRERILRDRKLQLTGSVEFRTVVMSGRRGVSNDFWPWAGLDADTHRLAVLPVGPVGEEAF